MTPVKAEGLRPRRCDTCKGGGLAPAGIYESDDTMEWIKVKIDTNKPGIEFVSRIFADCGILSLEIDDNEEFLQVLEQTRPQWDFVEDGLYREKSKACAVAAYLANNAGGKTALRLIEGKISQARREHKNYGSLEISIAVLDEEDWAENWKKYFKPIPVGENILICPEWEDVPDEYKSRVVFKVDPGMSFGTGTHETTRLCAAALEKHIRPGGLVLDLGCGSGILSIIALLLGAEFAAAVDIDENSARIASDNARANNIEPGRYKTYADNPLEPERPGKPRPYTELRYDMILMNIIPDVIIPLLPAVRGLLAEGGVCVLSGIIGKYLPEVENACKACGFEITGATSENDWQCLVVRIKKDNV